MDAVYDVIVAGGGWGGTMAAVSAARAGAKTLLIESREALGGTATLGSMCEIDGAYTKDGRCVMPEAAMEIIRFGIARGDIRDDGWVPMTSNPGFGAHRIRFNPEQLKLTLDRFVREAGADVLFMAPVRRVEEDAEGVTVTVSTPYKELAFRTKTLVDATGNSEAFYLLDPGCTVKTPAEKVQSATMCYRLGGVDMERYAKNINRETLSAVIEKGVKEGALSFKILASCPLPGMNEVSFNTTRAVEVDIEDPMSFTRGIAETREQIERALPFLKQNLAGLENAYLAAVASSLGIRDRRRIAGVKVLSGEDILKANPCGDAVAFGCYPVDVHREGEGHAVQFTNIGGNGIYSIPFSSMITEGHAHLIAGCKAISSDDTAFAAHRVISTVSGIGYAAGLAAAKSNGADVRNPDIASLKETLRAQYPECTELIV